jgi:hypothetical protein
MTPNGDFQDLDSKISSDASFVWHAVLKNGAAAEELNRHQIGVQQ